jgi:hypothetical protein
LCRLALHVSTGLGVEQKSNNKTIETQDFGENENKNHTNEKSRLLCGTSDTSVTNNANSEAGSETGQTDGQTSTELDETGVQRRLLLERSGDKDGNNETVNGKNTSHNHGDGVLDEQVRSKDGGSANTNTRLGGSVRSAETGEDNGGSAADGSKEGLS